MGCARGGVGGTTIMEQQSFVTSETSVGTEGVQDKQAKLMNSAPVPSPHVQGTVLDDETVLLDLSSGRYYALNRVGTAIWEQCTAGATMNQILAVLSSRFDASSERIADDLISLVTQLSHEGLLTLEGR